MGSRSPSGPGEAPRHRNDAVRHLTVVSRDLEARMRTGLVEEQGFSSLRASLGPLFFLIGAEPRSITALARQLGVSKQACSQLASFAERAGYLERIPSTADGRSKLLQLSARGRSLVERSVEIIRQTDADYAEIVGPTRYAQFTRTVAALYKALELPDGSALSFIEETTRTVGTLPLVAQRAQQALLRATAARGHRGLKLSHGQVLPFAGCGGGIRLSDLARTHGVAPRALGTAVRDLVALGYLRREPDPLDRRGALLFLTGAGERLVSDSVIELGRLRERIERALGKRVVDAFRDTAARLHAALAPDEDVFDPSSTAPAQAQEPPDRDAHERAMERLAARLRDQLGPRRSLRLAELLQSQATGAR